MVAGDAAVGSAPNENVKNGENLSSILGRRPTSHETLTHANTARQGIRFWTAFTVGERIWEDCE